MRNTDAKRIPITMRNKYIRRVITEVTLLGQQAQHKWQADDAQQQAA